MTISCTGQCACVLCVYKPSMKPTCVEAKWLGDSAIHPRQPSAKVKSKDGPESTCLSVDPGPGPSFGSEHIGRLRGVGALWDCVPRVCGAGGGGCAGGGVPLGAVPALSWCGEVSPGGLGLHSILGSPDVCVYVRKDAAAAPAPINQKSSQSHTRARRRRSQHCHRTVGSRHARTQVRGATPEELSGSGVSQTTVQTTPHPTALVRVRRQAFHTHRPP